MTYQDLVNQALKTVPEIMPWDLEEALLSDNKPLILDIRELKEYDTMHIAGSVHSPRGVLESACEWGYDDTMPILAGNKTQKIVLVCRSGKRSALAGLTMQQLGFSDICSLNMGIKGWNDNDLPMIDKNGAILDGDEMDEILSKPVSPDKQQP